MSENNAMNSIMQTQINTLQCTIQSLTAQRNAVSDNFTNVQTASLMKDAQIKNLKDRLEKESSDLAVAKAQSTLWNERFAEMNMRSAALQWYIEQLFLELPESPVSAVDTELLANIVKTYQSHLAGEKLKINVLRLAEIQEESESPEEEPKKDEPDRMKLPASRSLLKKDKEPVVVEDLSPSAEASRKIKGASTQTV